MLVAAASAHVWTFAVYMILAVLLHEAVGAYDPKASAWWCGSASCCSVTHSSRGFRSAVLLAIASAVLSPLFVEDARDSTSLPRSCVLAALVRGAAMLATAASFAFLCSLADALLLPSPLKGERPGESDVCDDAGADAASVALGPGCADGSVDAGLDGGADVGVDGRENEDAGLYEALLFAVEHGGGVCARELLRRAPAGAAAASTHAVRRVLARQDGDGHTLLHAAGRATPDCGIAEAARCLIDASAALDSVNILGETPLLLAVRSSADAAAVGRRGAASRAHARDDANGDSFAVVRLLLERRAGVDIADAVGGETPLMEATCRASAPLVRLLLEFRADPLKPAGNGVPALGFAPMSAASPDYCSEVLRLLLEASGRSPRAEGSRACGTHERGDEDADERATSCRERAGGDPAAGTDEPFEARGPRKSAGGDPPARVDEPCEAAGTTGDRPHLQPNSEERAQAECESAEVPAEHSNSPEQQGEGAEASQRAPRGAGGDGASSPHISPRSDQGADGGGEDAGEEIAEGGGQTGHDDNIDDDLPSFARGRANFRTGFAKSAQAIQPKPNPIPFGVFNGARSTPQFTMPKFPGIGRPMAGPGGMRGMATAGCRGFPSYAPRPSPGVSFASQVAGGFGRGPAGAGVFGCAGGPEVQFGPGMSSSAFRPPPTFAGSMPGAPPRTGFEGFPSWAKPKFAAGSIPPRNSHPGGGFGVMSAVEKHYRVLGLTSSAKADEVKRAYRKLALLHHPDKNADQLEAAEKFRQIKEAYEEITRLLEKKA